MALFSTRSDYALIILSVLAKAEGYVSLRTIAEHERLPYRYITRLASTMKDAGYIKSREGIKGGYALAKKPKDIHATEILELFEGPFGLMRCSIHGIKCPREKICRTRSQWSKLSDIVFKIIRTQTIADFV